MLNRLAGLALIAGLAAGLSACGGDDPITAKSEKQEEVPPLTAEVVHTFFSEDPLARFAVEFKNPGETTRVGVTATWKALDKDGVIVGTYDTELGPIEPGKATYYVGGAGGANLTGVPAQVEVEVTNEGEAVAEAEPSGVSVGKVEFKKAGFSYIPGVRSFEVSMVLTANRDLDAADIGSAVLLRNKAGKVVGADWADTSLAPAQIAAGEKIRVTAVVNVREGTPVSAEGYAWE